MVENREKIVDLSPRISILQMDRIVGLGAPKNRIAASLLPTAGAVLHGRTSLASSSCNQPLLASSSHLSASTDNSLRLCAYLH